MTEGFMRKEPLNSTKLHEHLEVVALFTRENMMPFFEKFHGYDKEVTGVMKPTMVEIFELGGCVPFCL